MYKSLVFLLAMTCGAGAGFAQSTTLERYHDAQGNPRGRLVQEGNRAVLLDQNGNREGYYARSGSRCENRSMQGNLRGYSTGSMSSCP